jgi:hypothetical protein
VGGSDRVWSGSVLP